MFLKHPVQKQKKKRLTFVSYSYSLPLKVTSVSQEAIRNTHLSKRNHVENNHKPEQCFDSICLCLWARNSCVTKLSCTFKEWQVKFYEKSNTKFILYSSVWLVFGILYCSLLFRWVPQRVRLYITCTQRSSRLIIYYINTHDIHVKQWKTIVI